MKIVVVSGINLFEGGPLSVLTDCLSFLNKSEFSSKYKIVALVHKKEIFDCEKLSSIEFHEFPWARKNYIFRLFYEFIYFNKLSKDLKVDFWLSLHDISPFVGKIPQAVYCHNPSIFNTVNLKDIFIQPKLFFFSLFYKYLYKINIHKNKFVVVQQHWIKNEFQIIFKLDENKIIVAPPELPIISDEYILRSNNIVNTKKVFFFPTYPRPFKNIEIICEAIKLLNSLNLDFEVIITIDGTENNYSKSIINKYSKLLNLRFVGILSREAVYLQYANCDFLIFPSKLETWGLPISEFKQFLKPMLVARTQYSRETVGNYKYVNFFDVNNPKELAKLMEEYIYSNFKFEENTYKIDNKMTVNNWEELFLLFFK